MMTKRKKRPRGLEGRRARAGVLFILPWLIGFSACSFGRW